MSRYERVALNDADDHIQGGDDSHTSHRNNTSYDDQAIPNSPPPSFRSRASSPTHHRTIHHDEDPLSTDADRALADAFDSPSDDEDDNRSNDDDDDFQDASEDARDRRRLIPGGNVSTNPADVRREEERERAVERRPIALPAFQPAAPTTNFRVFGAGNGNDGVFANLSAKPERGQQEDEKPPSYEAAAADATPPYWETTILAPGMMSDEVYVDGLPVGSVFSFLWNAMISMAFTFVGFLLTYLLHTTHAAKNGSRAGLGFTLVQYGFGMRGTASSGAGTSPDPTADYLDTVPTDPNQHDFDPTGGNGHVVDDPTMGGFSSSDWFAYTLMIVGWFILIRSVSDFYRARRHEMLVLQSPDRGLGVAVVAEGEAPESSV